jgi:hypothetical protein
MKKYILIIVLLVLSSFLFADITAVIKEVSGKVEIMVPGGRWKKASAGMKISEGDSISTGFRSEAVLTLGASQVIVKQLTRMELSELVEKEGTVRTGLNLRVGKIKAEVRTTAGLRQDFRLTSPVSTAAVRGTSFEYDGVNLTVIEGSVEFANTLGQRRFVPAGAVSQILEAGAPQSSEEIIAVLTSIDPSSLTIPQSIEITAILDFINDFNVPDDIIPDDIIPDDVIPTDIDVTITIDWGA